MTPFLLPPVIAHRGAAGAAPENTLAAFRLAAAHGAPWVEFDVRQSADGRCVVFHDETLERICARPDRIDETPLAVLNHLDAGSWFDPAFADQTIPTVEQALEVLTQLGRGVVIEIKDAPGAEAGLAECVLKALAKLWPASLPVVVSSFEAKIVAQLRDRAPVFNRPAEPGRRTGLRVPAPSPRRPGAGQRGARQAAGLATCGVVGGGPRARRRALALGRRCHHHPEAGRHHGRPPDL